MRIILNSNDGASSLDLMELARSAHFAIDRGIADQPPGYVMCVTIGPDPRNTFGVVRRKSSVSVYPPAGRETLSREKTDPSL